MSKKWSYKGLICLVEEFGGGAVRVDGYGELIFPLELLMAKREGDAWIAWIEDRDGKKAPYPFGDEHPQTPVTIAKTYGGFGGDIIGIYDATNPDHWTNLAKCAYAFGQNGHRGRPEDFVEEPFAPEPDEPGLVKFDDPKPGDEWDQHMNIGWPKL